MSYRMNNHPYFLVFLTHSPKFIVGQDTIRLDHVGDSLRVRCIVPRGAVRVQLQEELTVPKSVTEPSNTLCPRHFKFSAQTVEWATQIPGNVHRRDSHSTDCKIPGNMSGLAFHKSQLKGKDLWQAISNDEPEKQPYAKPYALQ